MPKNNKYILSNREDASKRLLDIMPRQELRDDNWKFIGISKSGLELAFHLRGKLNNKIDLLLLQTIKAPNNPECALACVSETEEMVLSESLLSSFEIQYDYVYGEAQRKHEEKIISNMYKYRKGRHFDSVQNQSVVLVDDGCDTGMGMLCAIKTILSMNPRAIYVAVPVLPSDVLQQLKTLVDDVFFIYNIDDYVETSLYYEELPKIDELRVEEILG